MRDRKLEPVASMAYAWLASVDPRYGQDAGHTLTESISLAQQAIAERGNWGAWSEPTRASFLEFVRTISTDTLAYCQYLAERGANFGSLHLDIDAIMANNSRLGAGKSGTVYQVQIGSEQAALKVGGVSESEVFAYYLGRNISDVSHLLGVDLDRHLALLEYLPGRPYRELSLTDRKEIPDSHIEQAVSTVIKLGQAGLSLDIIGDNMLYGPAGFRFCDYYYSGERGASKGPEHITAQLGKLVSALTDERGDARYTTRAEKAELIVQALEAIARVDPKMLTHIRAYRAESGRPEDFMIFGFMTNLLPRGQIFDGFRAKLDNLGIVTP